MECKHVIMPSDKSQQLDDFLTLATGKDRRSTILSRSCMTCDGDAIEFRDEVSRREYSVSGMCQTCQDNVWGNNEE